MNKLMYAQHWIDVRWNSQCLSLDLDIATIFQRLGKMQMPNLFADLSMQDKLELQAKKRKGDGTDDDGEYEAQVRRKMLGDNLIFYHLNMLNSVLEQCMFIYPHFTPIYLTS